METRFRMAMASEGLSVPLQEVEMSDLKPFDWTKLKWPEEYPKNRLVVADCLVDAFREQLGDDFEIIPLSETRLPEG